MLCLRCDTLGSDEDTELDAARPNGHRDEAEGDDGARGDGTDALGARPVAARRARAALSLVGSRRLPRPARLSRVRSARVKNAQAGLKFIPLALRSLAKIKWIFSHSLGVSW